MTRTSFLPTAALCLALSFLTAPPALAQLPPAAEILSALGYTADEIAGIEGGRITDKAPDPSTEREIAAGFAFHLGATPAKAIEEIRTKLIGDLNPDTISSGTISLPATAGDFAKLSLAPQTADRTAAYAGASAGDDLNLSTEEIAAFSALGKSATTAAVEQQLRASLLARVQAYQAKGLDGIAVYDRGSGKSRDVAADLRSATVAAKGLAKYAPESRRLAVEYPKGKPAGLEELFRWVQFEAHGVPTIVLVHSMVIPDGDAFIVVQRQYYVSEGFNCEEAVAAFLPVQDGTVVVYGNRTSTDQVTGFGGSAKRSIGSKLLASQLKDMFANLQRKIPG
jgi:hypothetical protein